MSETHYIASTDSALLRRVLREHSGGSALEIGAGNGGNLVELAGRFETVVGTDLTGPGMRDWSGEGAGYVLADCASCFRDSTFDLVAFNPPYVRGEIVDRSVDGGSTGNPSFLSLP
jgi:release factor glutamine methyltransferase